MESDITLNNSDFNNNKKLKGYYFVVTSELGNLNVVNCNFIGNDAGVRYGDGENTHCIIDSCNFINNG